MTTRRLFRLAILVGVAFQNETNAGAAPICWSRLAHSFCSKMKGKTTDGRPARSSNARSCADCVVKRPEITPLPPRMPNTVMHFSRSRLVYHPRRETGEISMGKLDGKITIVTGATSGIGRRTVEIFVAEAGGA